MGNRSLDRARDHPNDELYTDAADVLEGLSAVAGSLRGMRVLCDCDGPESAFRSVLSERFDEWGLASLTCTGMVPGGRGTVFEMRRGPDGSPSASEGLLDGNGDFRSAEVLSILDRSDAVVTNPPFSLTRPHMACILDRGLGLCVVANLNAVTYRDVFSLVRDGLLWLGRERPRRFTAPDGTARTLGNVRWLTNLGDPPEREPLVLSATYRGSGGRYPTFDGYDAIFVDRVSDIPGDYGGVMGVPITYLDRHDPDLFEVVGLLAGHMRGMEGIPCRGDRPGPYVGGRLRYARILIRRRARGGDRGTDVTRP